MYGRATATFRIDASEALEQDSAPREVTSQNVGFVNAVSEPLAARAGRKGGATKSELDPRVAAAAGLQLGLEARRIQLEA